MALASTSQAQLQYLEETTYGVIDTLGTPKKLRMTGEDLKFEIQTETTKEINSTRQVSDSIQVGAEASGGINFELSYHEYDSFIESLLSSTFSAFGTGGVKSLSVIFDTSTNTITDDGVDGFAGLSAGQWILISDSASNDGIYRIASMTNDVLTLDSATPLKADEGAAGSGVTVTVSSSRIANSASTALKSFSIEKVFADVSQYFMFTGMVTSRLELNIATGQILTGTFGFVGKSSSRSGATQFGASASASQSYGVMNAVDGVGAVSGGIGGILLRSAGSDLLANTYVQSMRVNIDAKLRGQKAVGVKGNAGIAPGTYSVEGTLGVYLADGSVYDEAIAGNLVTLTFPVHDVNNNGYAFTFENCKLGVPTVTAGGMDSDVILSIPFTAVAPDTSTDRMVYIDRFGAAV